MKTKSIYKVPNGKLIKIFMDYNQKPSYIKDIKITGDFFAYPEESIQRLEQYLIGSEIEKSSLEKMIAHFVKKNKIEFIGVSPESITEAVMRCTL